MCSVPLPVPEEGFNTAARVHMYVSGFSITGFEEKKPNNLFVHKLKARHAFIPEGSSGAQHFTKKKGY